MGHSYQELHLYSGHIHNLLTLYQQQEVLRQDLVKSGNRVATRIACLRLFREMDVLYGKVYIWKRQILQTLRPLEERMLYRGEFEM